MARIEDDSDSNAQEHFDEERNYPPIEVAEARIKQSLLRYKVAVEKTMPTAEKEKVRL